MLKRKVSAFVSTLLLRKKIPTLGSLVTRGVIWAPIKGNKVVTKHEVLKNSADGTSSTLLLARVISSEAFLNIALVMDSAAFLACCSNFVVEVFPYSIGLLKEMNKTHKIFKLSQIHVT